MASGGNLGQICNSGPAQISATSPSRITRRSSPVGLVPGTTRRALSSCCAGRDHSDIITELSPLHGMASAAAAAVAAAAMAKFKSRGRVKIEQMSERDNLKLDRPRYDRRVSLSGRRLGRSAEDAVEAVDIELTVEESCSLIETSPANDREVCKTVDHSVADKVIRAAAERQRVTSYANGQRRTNSNSELASKDPSPSKTSDHKPNDEDDRHEKPKAQQADMTTESFVPTEHHQFSQPATKQEIGSHQFANNAHQLTQPAQPIGLNRSSSSCSLGSSSYDDDDDADAECPDRAPEPSEAHADYGMISHCDGNNNSINNNNNSGGGNQATEKYAVISSSSLMSLSDEQQYGQSYDRGGGGGGGLTTSYSTNAINQSRPAASDTRRMIGRLVGKKASRIRELVLQNLGRADRTTDKLFDLYESNFYKQQQQVLQLTKEFKLYTTALKAYHEASKNLSKCIQQSTSGYQMARHDLICDNLSQMDSLNEDLMEKLQEKVIRSLGDYLTRFHEIKDKINKRHRKLVDYDSSRRLYELMYARVSKKRSTNAQQQQQQPPQHNYQSILRGIKFLSQQQQQQQQQQQRPSAGGHHANQESAIASQLVDEARLLKLREQFNYSKLMYETINGELHEELPIVYETKMKSLLNALKNYYDVRAHHHSNAAKLVAKVSDVMIVGSPASEDGNTILSIYTDGADKKCPTAARDTNSSEEGSGSSGVSLSGSASRSSGSSLASPDCDDQHRRQADNDEHRNESHTQAQEPKNGDLPADLGVSDRQFVEPSVESAGERGQEPSADVTGDVVAVCEPESVGSDDAEAQVSCGRDEIGAQVVEENAADGVDPGVDQTCGTECPSVGQVESVAAGDVVGDDLKSLVVRSESSSAKDIVLDCASSSADHRDYLYRVRTNYKYLAEDVDELCFEANEIIQVVEFDENHEPEDGWLLGVREVNNQRGLFPANFTQPI